MPSARAAAGKATGTASRISRRTQRRRARRRATLLRSGRARRVSPPKVAAHMRQLPAAAKSRGNMEQKDPDLQDQDGLYEFIGFHR